MEHNIESKNTGEIRLEQAKNAYQADYDSRFVTLEGIIKRGIDFELLEELKKEPLEKRIQRLELEMERRIQENVVLTLTFASVVKKIMHITPKISQLFSHFFGEDTKI